MKIRHIFIQSCANDTVIIFTPFLSDNSTSFTSACLTSFALRRLKYKSAIDTPYRMEFGVFFARTFNSTLFSSSGVNVADFFETYLLVFWLRYFLRRGRPLRFLANPFYQPRKKFGMK